MGERSMNKMIVAGEEYFFQDPGPGMAYILVIYFYLMEKPVVVILKALGQ
jgi:hypothetical protein